MSIETAPVSKARLEALEAKFARLAAEWKAGRGPTSSTTQMAVHPAYQQIIGIGLEAVPFLLRELDREPDHWFWALKAITGADPVAREHRGRLGEMAKAWLHWEREQSFGS